ncbi:MAG: winged helix-turn-helix transcriptional regulator [Eubacteriales bacterium]|nr:winged helix-turn-helix transcriptional regulator [Eubacteriales bacterium]
MDIKELQSILTIGETVAVEFKRCGNGIESDTYESVCSFLNRFGGDIFMGALDDGTVLGVPEKAAPDMIKNFISVVSNPALFSPTVYLTPKIITDEAGHTIIHVHVPPSAEVHSYKKVIYDRVDDADVKVTATGAIAQMYIRKQNIFTEKKIYPYATMEDLRLDLLPKVRLMAQNHAGGQHPWTKIDDMQLLKSAGLYGRDIATGEEGFNLAAIMLLGKDDVILNVAPTYVTDALVRKVNVDRYDDREIIKTNLIESYEQLLEFGRKHLPDKFFLEDTINKSLRNTIVREMVSNTLMHREFTSSYTAKFVIEKDQMYVENANRAAKDGWITVENLSPNPKNPYIAAFFRNIGYADQLGSGVQKLFEYSKYYSGRDPQFLESDVFRIIVPLDEAYSYDFALLDGKNGISGTQYADNEIKSAEEATQATTQATQDRNQSLMRLKENETVKSVLKLIEKNPAISQKQIAKTLCLNQNTVKYYIKKMKEIGIIKRVGSSQTGHWEIL